MITLTDYEAGLVTPILDILRRYAERGKAPHGDTVARKLMISNDALKRVRQYIDENSLLTVAPGEELKQELTDDTWSITVAPTRIHTLPQLLDYCKVDLDVWEVERFVVNKWEVGMKLAAITEHYTSRKGNQIPGWKRQDDKPIIEPLYQVKAFLRRRVFTSLAHATKENAKLRSQVEKLRLDVASERAIAKRLALNHVGYDDLLANIKQLSNLLGDLQLTPQRIDASLPQFTPPVSPGHTEDAVMMWSDQHFSDVIRREDTSGFPAYDLVIAGNRWGLHGSKG